MKRVHFKLLFFYFTYAALVAISVQLWVLPEMFPNLHAGEGLLKDSDGLLFHQYALHFLDNLRENGIASWSLNPEPAFTAQPAAFASLIYYFTAPEPWVLIPVNAFIHAFSGLLVFIVSKQIVEKNVTAIVASLPFVAFPSSVAWYSQIHRDGLFILGCYMIIVGMVKVLSSPITRKKMSYSLIAILGGLVLIGVTRDYFVIPMLLLSILVFLSIKLFRSPAKRIINPNLKLATVSILVFVMALFVTGITLQPKDGNVSERHADRVDWQYSPLVPDFIERTLNEIQHRRSMFYIRYPEAGSNLDNNFRLNNTVSMVIYVPRALVIGLFAPFPNMWFESGIGYLGKLQRRITGLEMVVSYLLVIVGLPSAMYFFRRKNAFWFVLSLSVVFIIILSISVPNIGALYRLRFGFYMLILAIGTSGLYTLFAALISKRKSVINMVETQGT